MTHAEYTCERERLLEILKDAEERGDYYLEMDINELLLELNTRYYNE